MVGILIACSPSLVCTNIPIPTIRASVAADHLNISWAICTPSSDTSCRNPGYDGSSQGNRTGSLKDTHTMTAVQTIAEAADDSITAQAVPTHSYRLRPDCTLRLELPDDLTRAEVKRLNLFLKSVVGIDGRATSINEVEPDVTDEAVGNFGFDDDDEFKDEGDELAEDDADEFLSDTDD